MEFEFHTVDNKPRRLELGFVDLSNILIITFNLPEVLDELGECATELVELWPFPNAAGIAYAHMVLVCVSGLESVLNWLINETQTYSAMVNTCEDLSYDGMDYFVLADEYGNDTGYRYYCKELLVERFNESWQLYLTNRAN